MLEEESDSTSASGRRFLRTSSILGSMWSSVRSSQPCFVLKWAKAKRPCSLRAICRYHQSGLISLCGVFGRNKKEEEEVVMLTYLANFNPLEHFVCNSLWPWFQRRRHTSELLLRHRKELSAPRYKIFLDSFFLLQVPRRAVAQGEWVGWFACEVGMVGANWCKREKGDRSFVGQCHG